MAAITAGRFTLGDPAIALPRGAVSGGHRRMLLADGRKLLGLTQGQFRPCLYPVFTPLGFAVTQESPADHPHHNSLWLAADHVHLRVPGPGQEPETYTYNFYVNQVFQGRAPGRQVEVLVEVAALADDAVRLTQHVEWRGPAEWGAPEGRLVLRETRRTTVTAGADATVIDVESTLAPENYPVDLGPTRHAFFNVRVAETLLGNLAVTDQNGEAAGRLPWVEGASWVDLSGPVGGGAVAGIAVLPQPGADWFVTDWGVATVGHWRARGAVLRPGETLVQRCRFVAHDGAPDPALLRAWHQAAPG